MISRRLRFRDLKERGIVNNWNTLKAWVRNYGFPPGQVTGPNTRSWAEDEIEAWLESRATEPKVIPPSPARRGRPRKTAEHHPET